MNAIVKAAREKGIKVGMIRPITLWPFPKAPLLKPPHRSKAFLSVELNMGQMVEDMSSPSAAKSPFFVHLQPRGRHDPVARTRCSR
jgi:2-oxoglutarate ferredoxin oxidoreductase subunit alpha